MRACQKPAFPPPPACGSGVSVREASCRCTESARAEEHLEGGAARVKPAQHRLSASRTAGVPVLSGRRSSEIASHELGTNT